MKRQALKRVLRRCGFEPPLEAETADDALVRLRGQPVQLVLTAWAPPGLTGVALLRALRHSPQDRPSRGAPAIVVLDDGLSQQQVVAAIKAGAAGRLALPAQAEALERILATLPGLAARARRPPREA
jgi:CheY-like chemotaxis protein